MSTCSVRRMLRLGQLSGVRIGRSWRVDRESVERLLREGLEERA